MKETFSEGWKVGKYEKGETVCGWGSEIAHTVNIRARLPELMKDFGINSINDAGCGDLCWISDLDISNIDYVGYDIVSRDSWGKTLACKQLDITKQVMRKADLIICRDVLIHLPNDLVLATLQNFRKSSRLLLTTTFAGSDNFNRIKEPSLQYSKIDLSSEPFNLGNEPKQCIQEDHPGKYSCLWRI
jgi:hypothetical protein